MFKLDRELNWEFLADDRLIRLIPAPDTKGTAVYEASILHTLETVPDKDKQTFLLWVQAICMEVMGRKRRKKITEVPTGSGSIKLDDGTSLRQEAMVLKEQFKKKLGFGLPMIKG